MNKLKFNVLGCMGQKHEQDDPCKTKARVVGDATYCDRYWECINNQPELYDCPNGLVFAGKHRGVTEGCDYPWRSNYCEGKQLASEYNCCLFYFPCSILLFPSYILWFLILFNRFIWLHFNLNFMFNFRQFYFYFYHHHFMSFAISLIFYSFFFAFFFSFSNLCRRSNNHRTLRLALWYFRSWNVLHALLDLLEWYCYWAIMYWWFVVQWKCSQLRLARKCRRLSETS